MKFEMLGMTLAVTLMLAAGGVAEAKRPTCNRCEDMTALEGELVVQEAIYNKVRQYVRNETDYQLIAGSPEALQAILEQAAKDAAGGGTGEPGEAAPSLVTDVTDKRCKIYQVTNGERTKFRKKKFKKLYCAAIADYQLVHELQHQKTCKQKWKAGTEADYGSTEYVAADEMVAYWQGIVSLRKSLAALARKCGWKDSCPRALSGPITVTLAEAETVPCRSEINRLLANIGALTQALSAGVPGR